MDIIEPNGGEVRRPTMVVVGLDPLNDWHKARWGIDHFRAKGFDVLYFNARALRHPDWKFGEDDVTRQTEIPEFSDPRSLRAALAGRKHAFVLSVEYLDDPLLRPLTEVFAALGVPCCQSLANLFPALLPPSGAREWFYRISFQALWRWREHGARGLAREVVRRARARLAPVREQPRAACEARYILVGGTSAPLPRDLARRIVVYGHGQDYEMALQQGLFGAVPAEEICVFFDQGLVGHRDLLALGATSRSLPDPRWYYRALFRCFETVTAATGLRVVVVPHPRFLRGADAFAPYEVRPGAAIATAARARLVLGHFSAALGLGVIFNKPVIQLVSRQFVRFAGAHVQRGIRTIRNELGCRSLSMDDPRAEALAHWREIDELRYAEYRRRYIQHPNDPGGSMWDALYRAITAHEGWHAPAAGIAPAPPPAPQRAPRAGTGD